MSRTTELQITFIQANKKMETREICQITGLSRSAVNKIKKSNICKVIKCNVFDVDIYAKNTFGI